MLIEITIIDVSAVTGLLAMSVLTLNILLGMLLGTAYKTFGWWKRLPDAIRKIKVVRIHNVTAYAALGLVLTHPLLLLLDASTKFTLVDIIYPVNAPHQKIFVALGTLAMLALLTVVISSQKAVRKKLSFRAWKNIHLVSYGTAMLFIVHGLQMDPELKDRPVDWFDGEKLLCLVCFFILIVATGLRWQYQRRLLLHRKQIS